MGTEVNMACIGSLIFMGAMVCAMIGTGFAMDNKHWQATMWFLLTVVLAFSFCWFWGSHEPHEPMHFLNLKRKQ